MLDSILQYYLCTYPVNWKIQELEGKTEKTVMDVIKESDAAECLSQGSDVIRVVLWKD